MKRAGVSRIRLYDLRHINASLLAPYTPLKVISAHLGHSSVAVTGDIYTHVLPGMQGQAIHALAARLFPAPDLHLALALQADREAPPGGSEDPRQISISDWLGEDTFQGVHTISVEVALAA